MSSNALCICRVYDVPVKGGTPYEQDVEVDPSISRKGKYYTVMYTGIIRLPEILIVLN